MFFQPKDLDIPNKSRSFAAEFIFYRLGLWNKTIREYHTVGATSYRLSNKSLFLGMLHAYYDCRTKDKFQDWFGNLWIGSHPTPLQGRYQWLQRGVAHLYQT